MMPRGIISKVDILSLVLKIKKELGDGRYNHCSDEWRKGYDHALNTVLDDINEYSN